MFERRKPKLRRKGEENGSVDWVAWRNLVYNLFIVMALCGLSFMTGAYYQKVTLWDVDSVSYASIFSQYKSSVIRGH